MRHAKSSWSHEGFKDFDRPLNTRGFKDAPLVAQHLRQQDLAPDELWCSPANRAKQTSDFVIQELALPAKKVLFKNEIYEAGALELLHLVRQAPESLEHIMLLGHNPGFSDLTCILQPKHESNLVTAAVVHLELSIDQWKDVSKACGHIAWATCPKLLRED